MSLLSLAAAAQVNNYYVSPSGNNSNDGSQARPWLTINYAASHFALGSSGATIHVADGTYLESASSCAPIGSPSSVCMNHGGTSSQPLVVQCDNGLNGAASAGHCTIRQPSNTDKPQFMTIAGVNYVTFQGFDLGGDSSHPATLVHAGILIYAKDGNGNFVQVNQNYIHDMASAADDGIGFGPGCPSEGMIVVDGNTTGGTIAHDDKFIGNFINNGGSLASKSCNQFHGIYAPGFKQVYENNIVGNVPGAGIKVFPSVCSENVSNNLVFHNGWWGILVKDSGAGGCAADGGTVGLSTIDNNMAINNGFNTACSGIMQPVSGSGTNLYSNNLLLGNSPNDNINQMNTSASCTSTALAGTISTFNGSNTSATIANTFINYRNDGTGDYHLRTGSVAIDAGTTTCVSGGISPCTPLTSLAGVIRPLPPSIGFDELGTSATSPQAPTNLALSVQ